MVNAPASQFQLSPIPPSADWQFHLAKGCPAHCQSCYLAGREANLTFKLISHRFTSGSKQVLQTWYPHSKLEMDETKRIPKRNPFGGIKYVYAPAMMNPLHHVFEQQIWQRFPFARILYWT